MKDEGMCYVAEDPSQPGAAWAVVIDEPRYAKDTAKDIATWVKQGAHVLRVDIDTAKKMLLKWVRSAEGLSHMNIKQKK